ncbi:MAG TPA: YgeY family selenium metabolism-linked hydrolase [Actinomycetota bacterium]|nr:YgeY family selenium metabolism-linked hydrolase [Actinomycetota bacterium]
MNQDERFAEAADHDAERMTRFLGDLIARPSLSRREDAVVQRIASEMTDLGFDEVTVDGFGSVIGRIGDGPVHIAYDSHIDVVDVGDPASWKTEPFSPVIEGRTLYGRGASDNKAATASMVYGAAMIKRLGIDASRFTIHVIGTVQEEDCDGLALEHILTNVLPDVKLVVLGEATNLNVYRGHRGRVEFALHTRGRAAHASAPERGVNAIYKMAPILQQIEELNERLAADPFLGKGTVVVSKVEAQTPSINAVPDGCTIYLDRRLTLGESVESARKELESLPAVQDGEADIELLSYEGKSYTGLTLVTDKYFPTWVIPENDPAVRAGVQAAERALGRTPEVGRWVFSTNGVASAGKLGITTIGFGPSNEVWAHSPDDQCPIDDLPKAAAWYAAFPDVYLAASGDRAG